MANEKYIINLEMLERTVKGKYENNIRAYLRERNKKNYKFDAIVFFTNLFWMLMQELFQSDIKKYEMSGWKKKEKWELDEKFYIILKRSFQSKISTEYFVF